MLPKPLLSSSHLARSYRSLPALVLPSSLRFKISQPAEALNGLPRRKGITFVEVSRWIHQAEYSWALKISANMGFLDGGRLIHCCMIKQGLNGQALQNQLLYVYFKCRPFADAYQLFAEVPKRNVVSWNMIICGFLRGGDQVLDNTDVMEVTGSGMLHCSTWHLAILYFRRMLGEMVQPDYITFISILTACVGLNDVDVGKQVHCYILNSGFGSNHLVGTSLVDLYAKFGFVQDALKMFDVVEFRDMVLWNVIVSCYNLNGLKEEAFHMFKLMRFEGFKGDGFTFTTLLNSCSGLGSGALGKQIHALVIKSAHEMDVLVSSAIVDMYAKSNDIRDARKAFDGMVARNVVSWATMIVGHGHEGDGEESIRLYKRMLLEGFKPDELICASLLSSCAKMAAFTGTIQFHAHVIKYGFNAFLSTGNSLINAYSKCGSIADALKSFKSISSPDLVTLTSLIGSYAFHGLAKEAIDLFEKMVYEGVKPDGDAFLAILSACSHAGLVVEGLHYFDSLRREYQILPDAEHYACLIDLLGRAGHLQEAYNVLLQIPFKPSPTALGTFMGACKIHQNVELATWVAEILLNMEPDHSVNYKLMSNLYATVGSWDDVAKIRKLMRKKCIHKMPGCSWIEMSGEVHSFVSGDKSHVQMLEICDILEILVLTMQDAGCAAHDDSSQMRNNNNDKLVSFGKMNEDTPAIIT